VKLEDQVVSLELAKRLKELGVKQESLVHWVRTGDSWRLSDQGIGIAHSYYQKAEKISAFTVAELLQMLPERTAVFQHISEWTCEHLRLKDGEVLESHGEFDTRNTAANACAIRLICLLEKKLLKPESLLKENG